MGVLNAKLETQIDMHLKEMGAPLPIHGTHSVFLVVYPISLRCISRRLLYMN